jgi:hypothetical protein
MHTGDGHEIKLEFPLGSWVLGWPRMKIRTGKGHTSHRDKWEQNEETNGNRMREQKGTE